MDLTTEKDLLEAGYLSVQDVGLLVALAILYHGKSERHILLAEAANSSTEEADLWEVIFDAESL